MKSYHFEYKNYQEELLPLFNELQHIEDLDRQTVKKIIKRHPKKNGKLFARDELVMSYRALAGTHGLQPFTDKMIKLLQMKPMRTMSGVTPVTVLTKPFPCPGKCIFCPNDIRMPKSYLSDEPGAQRAERNYFDPYLQTYNRLQAFHNIGHPIEKVELLILGGTWSFYPEAYQIWFIKECFRALNDFGVRDGRDKILMRYKQMTQKLEEIHKVALSNDPIENEKKLHTRKIKGEKLEKSYNRVISEVYVAPEKLAGIDSYQSATWDELEVQQKQNEKDNER